MSSYRSPRSKATKERLITNFFGIDTVALAGRRDRSKLLLPFQKSVNKLCGVYPSSSSGIEGIVIFFSNHLGLHVIPCALLALAIHPRTSHNIINKILWAFCVYLEAVSVLPQLRVMQNTKIVEPFIAHYVFALGVARFLSCAHWVLQIKEYSSYPRLKVDVWS
eukprot:Gb_35686 [translate_table: standard]